MWVWRVYCASQSFIQHEHAVKHTIATKEVRLVWLLILYELQLYNSYNWCKTELVQYYTYTAQNRYTLLCAAYTFDF